MQNKSNPRPTTFSNGQPIGNFVRLYVLTLGLYGVYWFYRNWRHLQDKYYHFKNSGSSEVSPGWYTIGLFIPILGIVLIYRQFRDIWNFAEEAGCDPAIAPGWLTLSETFFTPGWLTFGFVILTLLWKLPDPFWLLFLLSVLPLVVVQRRLNLYWEKKQPGFPIREDFSGVEATVLIVGGIFFLISVVGAFTAEQSNIPYGA